MGSRGPIRVAGQPGRPRRPNVARTDRRVSRDLVVVGGGADDRDEIPEPPKRWPPAAQEAWSIIWANLPAGVLSELDAPAVERLCNLVAEREMWAKALESDGPTQRVPLQNSRGDVIGEEIRLHPSEGALRRIDRALNDLSDRLALTPAARARLGLTVATTQLAAAQTVIAGMGRRKT